MRQLRWIIARWYMIILVATIIIIDAILILIGDGSNSSFSSPQHITSYNNNSFNNNSSTNVWRRTILHKNTFTYIYSVFLIFSNVFYVCVQKMLFNIRK